MTKATIKNLVKEALINIKTDKVVITESAELSSNNIDFNSLAKAIEKFEPSVKTFFPKIPPAIEVIYNNLLFRAYSDKVVIFINNKFVAKFESQTTDTAFKKFQLYKIKIDKVKKSEVAFEEFETHPEDLYLYIDSTGKLRPNIEAIEKNLLNKIKKGIYDSNKSLIAWQSLVDLGAKSYAKEVKLTKPWNVVFSKDLRKKVALAFRKNFELDNGLNKTKEAASASEIPSLAYANNKAGIEFVKKNYPGLTLVFNKEDHEYTVKVKGNPDADYFTNDLKDALLTARSIYKQIKGKETATKEVEVTSNDTGSTQKYFEDYVKKFFGDSTKIKYKKDFKTGIIQIEIVRPVIQAKIFPNGEVKSSSEDLIQGDYIDFRIGDWIKSARIAAGKIK